MVLSALEPYAFLLQTLIGIYIYLHNSSYTVFVRLSQSPFFVLAVVEEKTDFSNLHRAIFIDLYFGRGVSADVKFMHGCLVHVSSLFKELSSSV